MNFQESLRKIEENVNPMHTVKLARKSSTNEWLVVWYTNGRRDEGKTYYTNDKTDAIQTMQKMQMEADKLNRPNSTGLQSQWQ